MQSSEELTQADREALRRALEEYGALNEEAEEALGKRNWALLRSYGRMMGGPYSGAYVSGIPVEEVKRLIDELVRGREINVHLMHRHRSGNYESSALRFIGGKLIMHFADRDEIA